MIVLTWISIYWFSRAGPAASLRIYYELAKGGTMARGPNPTIPMGVSFFPGELCNLPRAYVMKHFIIYIYILIPLADG